MDEGGVAILASKLDAIVKLLVLQMTENKPLTQKVWLLSIVGYEPREIADMLGITANHVRVTLSNLRKHGMKRRVVGKPRGGSDE